ncbi:hypothetical protein V5O48_017971 [Marasmius crinis-equi]|uniref:Uncharacterized protein n=1 Tax=Marasmius crinis-equi TaxID=585013 RepID=A0ABR3EMN6_9AGAR
MTDNVFTGDVPDLYKQFMLATRIWGMIEAEQRAGVHHDLKDPSTQQLVTTLTVECPPCPKDGMNMEPGWQRTPHQHLILTRLTLDSNYQANHFAKKNCDPNDVLLWAGRGYLPIASVYNRHCGFAEPSSDEKSVCGHLKVVNKQNKVKFKNMDISGIVNCQCCHVFIRTSANLQCVERWVCVDECLARAVAQKCSPDKNKEQGPYVVSYDAMCSLCKRIIIRWNTMHPDYVHVAERMYWVIPVCHCRNHIESCEPLYLYVYKECVGEFKAETAEQAWDTLNALGASIRQMNLGAREDTLNLAIGDWNWRKTTGLSKQLQKEVLDLIKRCNNKRNFFVGLWHLHGDKALQWNAEDRSPRVDAKRKLSVKSVYMHDVNAKDLFETPVGKQKSGVAANFIQEGLALAVLQDTIQRLVRKQSPDAKEIDKRRSKLANRLKDFRKAQGKIMRADAARAYTKHLPCHPEEELLCLPSDFDEEERLRFKMVPLAERQASLVKGKLFDVIRALQNDVRALTAGLERKIKHARGQAANTRAMTQLNELQAKQDRHMYDYSCLRQMLEKLGALDEEWPELRLEDTYRK